MNFESLEFDEIRDYHSLYRHVRDRLRPEGQNYVLLDEVQQVTEWEKVVNSLRLIPGVGLYITGSNAYLLSSELFTLLSGRHVEIRMLRLCHFRPSGLCHDFSFHSRLQIHVQNGIP